MRGRGDVQSLWHICNNLLSHFQVSVVLLLLLSNTDSISIDRFRMENKTGITLYKNAYLKSKHRRDTIRWMRGHNCMCMPLLHDAPTAQELKNNICKILVGYGILIDILTILPYSCHLSPGLAVLSLPRWLWERVVSYAPFTSHSD